MKTLTVSLLVLLLCSAGAVLGQNATAPRDASGPAADGVLLFPKEISYQGLLTTGEGTPAATGSYNLKFDLFNIPAGGVSLWTETQNAVQVNNGVFTVYLGSVTPLTNLFYQELFLEVSALAGPGISGTVTFSPRTKLAASAYSLAPWASQFTDIYYNGGNVMVGTEIPDPFSKLSVQTHSRYAGRFESDSLSGLADVVHAVATGIGAADVAAVYGESIPQDWWGIGGQFIGGYHGVEGYAFPTGNHSYTGVTGGVSGGVGYNYGVAGTATGGLQNIGVYGAAVDSAGDYAGYFWGRLGVSSISGDSAVLFPDDALSAPEIRDEPGIASHSPFSSFGLPSGSVTAVDSVTITIPADGYVVAEGGGLIYIFHTNGTTDNVWTDVAPTAGAAILGAHQWGFVNASLPSGEYGSNFRNHRIYSLSAGTHTFYLNAVAWSGSSETIMFKWIKATYYPTSYGPVTTIMAADEGAGLPEASPEGTSTLSAGAAPQGAQEIDLRTLEIAALKARAQATKAEMEFLQARLAKEREKQDLPDHR